QEINVYHLSSGKKHKTIWRNITGADYIEKYHFSKDEQKLLLFTQGEAVYRRSYLYKVWIYDVKTGERTLIDEDKVLHAAFNPQGTKVAFVKDNNIFIKDIATNSTKAITTDGEKNKIINGNCDWVYEEEWEFTKAYEWSDDG